MFLSAHRDRARLPVAILSGFLGSGKTTLLNALLRDPRLADTAVAVNEFGDVPLDQHLIDHGTDRTIVLANGCLCCNVGGDMEDAILRVFSRRSSGELPSFARLIIEPSGLADPAPIIQAILRNPVMARVLRLDAIVTTMDTLFAEAQLDRHPETRKQAALADRLVLTKTDLARPGDPERVTQAVRRHNQVAPILIAQSGAIDPTELFPARFFDGAGAADDSRGSFFVAEAVEPPCHDRVTEAVSLTAEAPLQWRAFDAWLRTIRLGHAEQLLRVKGLLNLVKVDGPVAIHGVHHVLHAPVALDRWPGADRRSHIVMIVQGAQTGGVSPAAIRASWEAALPSLIAAE